MLPSVLFAYLFSELGCALSEQPNGTESHTWISPSCAGLDDTALSLNITHTWKHLFLYIPYLQKTPEPKYLAEVAEQCSYAFSCYLLILEAYSKPTTFSPIECLHGFPPLLHKGTDY